MAGAQARAVLGRGLGFAGLWLVLGSGMAPGDFVVGAAAVALATALSLRLLPPSGGILRPGVGLRLVAAILRDSVGAGIDIARRVFDPRLPIQPGEVAVPLAMPPGPARDGVLLLASLQPGTLPAGTDAQGRIVLHALDTALPVEREMQALVTAATGRDAAHG